MRRYTFKNLIQILIQERLPFSRNLSPVTIITKMNNLHPTYGIDLESFEGVYDQNNESLFFKMWFNRLYSKYQHHFCYSSMRNSDPDDKMEDVEWGMDFIYELLGCFEDSFREMYNKYNLFDGTLVEDEKNKILNPKYETSNSSVSVGGDFPTVIQNNEVLNPATKEGTVNTYTITDEKDYLNRLFYIIKNYPTFWDDFLNNFKQFFCVNNYGDVN